MISNTLDNFTKDTCGSYLENECIDNKAIVFGNKISNF